MTDFHCWKKLAVLASLSLLTACSNVERNAPPSQAADFLFWKGAVYTVDEGRPWAEAVAVKDGNIQFVGSNEQAKAHMGAETQVIGLDEQMLLPGFIDTHAHPVLAAGMSPRAIPNTVLVLGSGTTLTRKEASAVFAV